MNLYPHEIDFQRVRDEAPETLEVAKELAGALRSVLADCDRRNSMYGEASVRLSTQVRLRADAALKRAALTNSEGGGE